MKVPIRATPTRSSTITYEVFHPLGASPAILSQSVDGSLGSGKITYVKEEQNSAIPAILRRIPNKSNLFIVPSVNFSV